MTRTAIVVFAFLIWLTAQDHDLSKILAMEHAWNRAELHNDAAAVQLLLADDFVMTVGKATSITKFKSWHQSGTSLIIQICWSRAIWLFILMAAPQL
jgi:hypothetical protein